MSDVWIGSFAGEAFPAGIPGKLEFEGAWLEAREGNSTVSFVPRHSAGTILDVIDGTGRTHTLSGRQTRSDFTRRTFAAPVKVVVRTTDRASAVTAALEGIESP